MRPPPREQLGLRAMIAIIIRIAIIVIAVLIIETGLLHKMNFKFRMIYFGYISEEPQFRLNLG